MSNVFLSKREFFLKILWIKKMLLILWRPLAIAKASAFPLWGDSPLRRVFLYHKS